MNHTAICSANAYAAWHFLLSTLVMVAFILLPLLSEPVTIKSRGGQLGIPCVLQARWFEGWPLQLWCQTKNSGPFSWLSVPPVPSASN